MVKLPEKLKLLLQKQQYRFIGSHSAVKICTWTKKSLLDQDICYKQKFYGIESHRCCQLSNTIGFCQNRCVYCWRSIEHTIGHAIKGKVDFPKQIIKNAVKAQQLQLIGFKGNKNVNLKKLKEAMAPTQFAISLSGEPLIYPKLNELIKELRKQKKTIFVVTNGLMPEKLAKLYPPTQLYLSISAPDEKLFKKINTPQIKNAWKKLNKSLSVLKKLKKKTRTAVRITLIKDLNMVEPENYAKLIKKASPNFVEVKAYMAVGASRQRLSLKNMPSHSEVKAFAEQIARHSCYKLIDEKKESRVVLLVNPKYNLLEIKLKIK